MSSNHAAMVMEEDASAMEEDAPATTKIIVTTVMNNPDLWIGPISPPYCFMFHGARQVVTTPKDSCFAKEDAMENSKEAPESNTALITSGRKQSAQQDNMFPLKPDSETDIDVEKGQQVSGSSCGKTHENGNPTVSFWAFLHARYLYGLENPSPSAGECLRITFSTPSAWAVRVALLIGLFYWVDMTMNYNDFRVIPQAVVETWKQIPWGLSASRNELPPLIINIVVVQLNCCLLMALWTFVEMNHGLVKTVILIALGSLLGSMLQAMLPVPIPTLASTASKMSGAWGFYLLLRAILLADIFMNWKPSSVIVSFCIILELYLEFLALANLGELGMVCLAQSFFIVSGIFWWCIKQKVAA